MAAKCTLQTWRCATCGKPFQCRQYRFDRKYCSAECKPRHTKIDPQKHGAMRTMYEAGVPYARIADALKLSPRTVFNWVERECLLGTLQPRDKSIMVARIAARKAPQTSIGKRPCLMCSKLFASAGKHNRVCEGCKETEAWKDGPDERGFDVVTRNERLSEIPLSIERGS